MLIWRMEENMIGQFAISKAGHDKDNMYVIVAEEGEFVFLSDGKTKPPDKPKKKKRKHIRPVNRTVEEELLGKLQTGEKVYSEEIRYAVKEYVNAISRSCTECPQERANGS
ncbi:MAG: hypothetical protein K2P59_01215 [Acetatifactor sp.]|nr:hypothetical protein [Acetatifactor sp.]